MQELLCVIFVSWIVSLAVTEDCSPAYYFKEKRGNISNYLYPLKYPSNDCEAWYISGSRAEVITISISYMYIPGTCNLYYLRIGQDPLKKYCGTQPQVYVSKTAHVIIKYVGRGAGTGFNLQYITGPLYNSVCKSDEFMCISNSKCIYKKWICNGLSECEDSSDEFGCDNTFTETIPATTTSTTSTVIPPICDSSQISCISKRTNKYICLSSLYQCDGKNDCSYGEDEIETNCKAKYCSNKYETDSGYITSPSFPQDYPHNEYCQWIIHIRDINAKIQIRFKTFEIQSDADTDYVIIYDGASTAAPILGKYYGRSQPPSVIESSTNWVLVTFHSDSFLSEKGFNMTYQKKGLCLPNQIPCGSREFDCYEKDESCDGVWHCKLHGGDEKGCGNCKKSYYTCGHKSAQCYTEKDRCSGVARCTNKADEYNCTSIQCGTHNGTFLCDNKHCIYETWQCDKTNDCGDNSDEMDCPRSTNLIKIAAVAGSMICSLLLVVALGCTCKLYNLRMQQLHGPRYETPLTRFYAEFMRRRAPPPYHEAMLTSRPYEEARREYLEQLNGNGHTNSRNGRRNRRRASRGRGHLQPVAEQTPTENSSSQNTETTEQPPNDIQIPIETSADNSTNRTHVNIDRQSSQTALINNSDSDDSSESDLDNGQREGVQVEFSDEGISAHWRRNNRVKLDTDSDQETASQQIPSNSGEVCSMDNTIASCDSVESPKSDDEQDKNTQDIQICDNTPTSSSNNQTHRPHHHHSQDSLNSSGSESTSWGEFVA